MFEGVVSQVLAGYLGRYVKGIQKDQLKIGIWNELNGNSTSYFLMKKRTLRISASYLRQRVGDLLKEEEILLEKVELILEAFDYLQLPFALQQGQVGKLSIKIPWKKLGWDSINIVLEDVFICACRRDDNEWSSGSVEKRQSAAKMAKLNAAELAKFSKRVCDNQAGQSFISYISAKILDNIQLYIRNVHVVYIDTHKDLPSQEKFIFGLRFSSLTIKTDSQKQNSIGSYGGKTKSGQVNKTVEISKLGIYWNVFEENPLEFENCSPQLSSDAKPDHGRYDYVVSPFDFIVSLLVNKSASLEDSPRYNVVAELTSLVILLNENQLRQILSLWDYFSVCTLREKYGRYRPSQIFLSRKTYGWQKRWWHYAQESILADVRLRLRKASWSTLGRRISCRRKYVNLYKRKLEMIQQDQPADNDILQELEQLDKESEIEDILNYRSIAEKKLQEFLMHTKPLDMETNYGDDNEVKLKSDEGTSSRARSWLSWLSLGMLGAGGTADSSSFSGIVSDEIIKDIYEAAEFHPLPSLDDDATGREKTCLSSIKLNVHETLITMASKRCDKKVALILFNGVSVECKIWEQSAAIMALINSAEIINPCDENVMLISRKGTTEDGLLGQSAPFISIQLKKPYVNQDTELSVVFQPFEVTYDSYFLWNLSDFHHILLSYQNQSKKVLSSLNGFEDVKTRLLSKAEYIFSNRGRLIWDVNFNDILIKFPHRNQHSEYLYLVLEFKTFLFRSASRIQSGLSLPESQEFFSYSTKSFMPISAGQFPLTFQLHDLYDHFEMELTGLQGQIRVPNSPHVISAIEKFNASATFALCIFLDEPLLRQLEVYCIVRSLGIFVSPSMYSVLVELLATLSQKQAESDLGTAADAKSGDLNVFQYSLFVKMDCFTLHMNLEDDKEDCSVICFNLENITTRCTAEEFIELVFLVRMIKVDACTSKNDLNNIILCSSRNGFVTKALHLDAEFVGLSSTSSSSGGNCFHGECFHLHYQAQRSGCLVGHDYNVLLNDLDFHIHPRIFGLLQHCCNMLFAQSVSPVKNSNYSNSGPEVEMKEKPTAGVELQKHGFFNFCGPSSSNPLDHFPFVTVENSGVLSSIQSAFTLGISEWRSMQVKSEPPQESQKSDFKKRSRILNCSAVKPMVSNTCDHSRNPSYVHVLDMDINLHGIRIYFHDSSCILGTIALPLCRSFFSFQGTDCWDLSCSAYGLSLSTSWFSPNVQVLFGSALPNVSSVLNIRARREKVEADFPVTEISFGIQHVNCTLSSEFLAMLIGYFALPDWTSKQNEQHAIQREMSDNADGRPFDLLYKFEILDSHLSLPLEGFKDHCLQIGLPLMYCSFIPNCSSADALVDIPTKSMIASTIGVDRLDLLNMFGYDISLSLMMLKDDKPWLEFPENVCIRKTTIIEKLDADLWVRIPCEMNAFAKKSSVPTIIVMKADTLSFLVEDDNFVFGLQAAINAVDQFATVGKESECFKSDVLQFMQLKKSLKEAHANSVIDASGNLVTIEMNTSALSIKLNNLEAEKKIPSHVIAESRMQVVFIASLKDDMLISLDVVISGLLLHSFYSSVLLLSSISEGSISRPLCINFSKSDQGDIKLQFAIPFLDMWLYFSDWNKLVHILHAYIRPLDSAQSTSSGRENRAVRSLNYPESQIMSMLTGYEQVPDDLFDITVKSENICISVHLPLDYEKDSLERCRKTGLQEFPYHIHGENIFPVNDKYCKFLKFTLRSKDIEMTVSHGYVKLKSDIEKARVILEIIKNCKISSMPFILISEVNLAVKLLTKQQQLVEIMSEVQIKSLDVGLSNDVFRFLHGVRFINSEAALSEIPVRIMTFSVGLQKGSLLLSDGKWSCNGPILEIIVRNTQIEAHKVEHAMEVCTICNLLVNYNNIHKVMWEAFIEPWSFQLKLVRKQDDVLINSCGMTDISLKSTDQLNLNITEPLIEVILRVAQMFNIAGKENAAWELHDSQSILQFQSSNDLHAKRHAPYILYNDTSLPLLFWVSCGPPTLNGFDNIFRRDGKSLQPGSSVPIYVEETPNDPDFSNKTSHSSEKLFIEKKASGVAHHMISIQLDGTSRPSKPMSMDFVGISYFEVNFSDSRESGIEEIGRVEDNPTHSINTEKPKTDPFSGVVVPVVFEVSMHGYSKLVRLYSTVILFNATSMPLELRFDIPFGVSPKILDPILPQEEFPLPVHLAEAGRIRWRPVGSDYLWSDAYSLSNMLSKENRAGFLRSFVCYPAHPTSDPFRCCISIEEHDLLSRDDSRKSLSVHRKKEESPITNDQRIHNHEMPKKWLIRQVKLTTPLLVKNYLPAALSLTIDSGGITHSLFLSEEDAASVFQNDSTHDLCIMFHMQGFNPTSTKFSRADRFMELAKLNESKFCTYEMLAFYPDTSNGPVFVTLEKKMDAFCGARELVLSVPFLLYNCTGIPLAIVDGDFERKGQTCILPSSYNLIGQEQSFAEENGLSLLSNSETFSAPQNIDIADFLPKSGTISRRENAAKHSHVLLRRKFLSPDSPKVSVKHFGNDQDPCTSTDGGVVSSQWKLSHNLEDASRKENEDSRNVKACMYSPLENFPVTELLVRLQAYLPQSWSESNQSIAWSSSFSLVPASGSTTVIIPWPCTSGAFLLSVTSSPIADLSGRTRTVIFQPRYVICNACSKELFYKQKGTNLTYSLGVGRHSHLHWTDRTRDLLISIRFSEPGGQWSGSFLPDCLGDAQLKMRNYVSGALSMVRVEVQNADMSTSDQKNGGGSKGTSGTHLILLSDDNTGFMPYRIDNFTMERLRVYQQKCEMFETIVHSYTSCQYAWDEPCYSHRLIIEVPGERILGTYSFDDVREYMPVYLPQTSERPERKFHIGVHAEGAIKVLSMIDSSYHNPRDMKESSFLGFKGKRKINEDHYVDFSERMTIQLSSIGISLVNSSPQELLFACAKDTTVVLLQNLDQQKISFQFLSLQVDNQLRGTPYPIILSFDQEHTISSLNHSKNESKLTSRGENERSAMSISKCESIIHLAAAKWRNRESSLVSFEYINIRVSPLRIDLEERILLHLLDFYKTVSSRMQSNTLQGISSEMQILDCCAAVINKHPSNVRDYKCKKGLHSCHFLSAEAPRFLEIYENHPSLPSIVPIGAPWQQIFLLARKQKKIYVEVFELAPINLTVSFSSTPWIIANEGNMGAESLLHFSSTKFQRGLMALVDVEGVPVHLRELTLTHLMASLESIQEILVSHYTRQILHEMYKVFGSAGVIGNPMGFARNVGLGLKDFLSVSAEGVVQSPSKVITGMAQGSKSLLSSTVYAVSNAATQFSKAAHKGIVAFTFDEQAVAKMEKQRKGLDSHGKGVLNEFFEGLTGLLQSPIRGAEEHGLPGVLSGIVLGTAGLIARPIASILEATGKTAQSIRNRSSPHQPKRYHIRFPRPVARDLPLLPYSWEEAIGMSALLEADNCRLKDEILVFCKPLKQAGRFLIITERVILVILCSSLIGLGSPDFAGIADPDWVIEMEMGLESVIHIDRHGQVVNIVGSNTEALLIQKRSSFRNKQYWSHPTSIPFSHMSIELRNIEEAEDVLQVLQSTIKQGEAQRWGMHVLHRSNIR